MKHTLKHYGAVALLLAVILLATTLLSLCTHREETERTTVLVTSYPLYVAAQQVLSGTDVIELRLLSGAGAGCLHDYQLTPADRLALERAHTILTVGAEAETFLEGVDAGRVVNTAEGLDLLTTEHHHEGEHHQESNDHVWMSPRRYSQQVLTIMQVLMELDPDNTAIFRENAGNYLQGVDYVWSRMQEVALSGRPCVLFHDSLSYLAEDLGLDVRLTLTAEGESGIPAEDLAQVERLAKENPDLLLIYDTQYAVRYGVVPADRVLELETAVVKESGASDWLHAMERNAEKLQQLGGDAP